MSSSINNVQIMGNLGKEPVTGVSQSGVSYANFTIATTERFQRNGNWEEATEWHNITAFGKTAETVGKYLQKGSKVLVNGKLNTSSFERDGVTHYTTKIVAREIIFIDRIKDVNNAGANNVQQQAQPQQAPVQQQYAPQQAAPQQQAQVQQMPQQAQVQQPQYAPQQQAPVQHQTYQMPPQQMAAGQEFQSFEEDSIPF